MAKLCFQLRHSTLSDQLQLFRPRQRLDCPLPPQGTTLVRHGLPINRLYRQTAAGVLGPFAAVMDGYTVLQIGGDSSIQASVSATQDVYDILQSAHLLFFLLYL